MGAKVTKDATLVNMLLLTMLQSLSHERQKAVHLKKAIPSITEFIPETVKGTVETYTDTKMCTCLTVYFQNSAILSIPVCAMFHNHFLLFM